MRIGEWVFGARRDACCAKVGKMPVLQRRFKTPVPTRDQSARDRWGTQFAAQTFDQVALRRFGALLQAGVFANTQGTGA